jgi:hypothetical protein
MEGWDGIYFEMYFALMFSSLLIRDLWKLKVLFLLSLVYQPYFWAETWGT